MATGGGRHDARRQAPARVLRTPPPGGPTPTARRPPPGGPAAPRVATAPRRPRTAPRHRRQRVHLTERGWVVLRLAFGVLMTGVIAATWVAVGQGGSSAGASGPAGHALPLRTAAPTPTPPITQLGADGVPVVVEQAVAAAGGTISVAVYDAVSRRTWTYHDTAGQVEASVSKLQVLGAELADVGAATPSSSAQSLMAAMIENSDNDAADALFERVGRSGLTAFDQAVGAVGIVPDSDGEFGLDTTTAAAQVAVMRAFAYANGAVSDTNRARAGALLDQVESDQRWGATGGVPAGVQVEVKDGWLPHPSGSQWVVNTVGHVHGAGRDYVVAILSHANATEQAGIDRLETVSAAVWSSSAAST